MSLAHTVSLLVLQLREFTLFHCYFAQDVKPTDFRPKENQGYNYKLKRLVQQLRNTLCPRKNGPPKHA